ncbi:hypothetical protein ASC77_12485 [Nocardioides sp. Root1257]|uniref:hypothetical protein n=1 Tax=unclassified Nocardioides TaxID=2615069 RepID=UPI0006F238CD|nr:MULTISPECIES: hypothetical protein [unclassified Nocardioides]KQW47292.1 hypothetical protein ASC77_12485 [Nocardioides sp. Root1257]KRC45448.1 hypothetical protein ASE24_12490 [Nocardioides sp. Root224]
MTRIGLAAAGLGMAALLTACGGGDDFTDQSGQKIADASKKAMKGLDAVKVAGTVTTDGQEIAIDVQTNDQGDCTGSLGVGGGTTELLGVDGDVWFRPDEAFWRASAPDSADQVIAAVGDKWVAVSSSDDSFGEFCDIDDLLDELISSDGDEDKTYSVKEVVEVDGDDAVPVDQKDDDGLSTGYVLVDEPHYLVKIEKTEGDDTGSVTFSEFDEDFDVTAPPEGDVISLDDLEG